MEKLRLFISHSSQDKEYTKLLIDLIRSALNIPAEQIRCTSIDGHRLPSGADTMQQLRAEIDEAETFIGVISERSLASHYVLFELGARWGLRKQLNPVLAPGTNPRIVPAPLGNLNALQGDQPGQLHQLIRELSAELSLTPSAPAVYQGQIDAIVAMSREETPTANAGVETYSYNSVSRVHLQALEDQISKLHPDVRKVSQVIYEAIRKANSDRVELPEEDYGRFARALAILESNGFIKATHSFAKSFVGGFWVTEADYILYLCDLYEDSAKMRRLSQVIDEARGSWVNGIELSKKLELPLPVVKAVFKLYDKQGLGNLSSEIGTANYFSRF